MKISVLTTLILLLAALPLGAAPDKTKPTPVKQGNVGVDQGEWQVNVLDAGRTVGLNPAQFSDFSISLVPQNSTSSQVSLSAVGSNDKNLSIMLDFPSGSPGTFAFPGEDNTRPHLSFSSSEFPQPQDAPFFQVVSGSVTVKNSPAVGAYVDGLVDVQCEFRNESMQPVKTFQIQFKFRAKRLL